MLESFSPAVRAWFAASFPAPTGAQVQGWPPIRAGQHTLICAPTGSGKTLVGDGAWSASHMASWNEAVATAAAKHPSLKVYDWASVVQDAWFQQDHIHYTSEGYAHRASMIAGALAAAYPA